MKRRMGLAGLPLSPRSDSGSQSPHAIAGMQPPLPNMPWCACRAFQNGRTLGKQGVPTALLHQLHWREASWAACQQLPAAGQQQAAPAHAAAVVSLQAPDKVQGA